jgi:hypothetical protein
LAFKLQVVEEIEKGELTSHQSRKKYGIQGKSTALVWLRKYGTLDWNLPNQRILKPNKEKTPEQRIKELEAALEEEKLKSTLLDTMINIAEKQYGFNIRKKSSPKQQSNSSKQK